MIWLIKNDLAEIEKLAEKIEIYGESQGIPAVIISHINLSLDELITNIINYGYRDGLKHQIKIDLQLSETEIAVELRDDALPFNPLERPDPDINKKLDDRQIGGLGIYLVRQLMDQVEYRRQGEENIMFMKKCLRTDC